MIFKDQNKTIKEEEEVKVNTKLKDKDVEKQKSQLIKLKKNILNKNTMRNLKIRKAKLKLKNSMNNKKIAMKNLKLTEYIIKFKLNRILCIFSFYKFISWVV